MSQSRGVRNASTNTHFYNRLDYSHMKNLPTLFLTLIMTITLSLYYQGLFFTFTRTQQAGDDEDVESAAGRHSASRVVIPWWYIAARQLCPITQPLSSTSYAHIDQPASQPHSLNSTDLTPGHGHSHHNTTKTSNPTTRPQHFSCVHYVRLLHQAASRNSPSLPGRPLHWTFSPSYLLLNVNLLTVSN